LVTFNVYGLPGPQGSKKAIPLTKGKGAAKVYTGKVAMVESSAKVKPWRAAVAEAARQTVNGVIPGPVNVAITFFLPRPKSHYGTGRNAKVLKPGAPLYPEVKPDLDKLIRATLDALTTAGVYADDSKVVDLHTSKRYADHRTGGATISVYPKASTRAATEGAA
jgi:Holliday junction resolvase RusA-like endonuclease